jgi:hypothetical protein
MVSRLQIARLLGAATLATIAAPAAASCGWEWLCNGEGNCKQMPVCDSVYETPPPRPDSAPPVVPPLAMRPHKITANMGGLTCEHIMRLTRSNRWVWSEACFCSDPEKTKDPSAPFANIVRCQTPWKEDNAQTPAPSGAPASEPGPKPAARSSPTATAAK